MIVVLTGADELAIRRRLQQLRDEADGGMGMLLANLAEIEGRDAKPHDILRPVMSPPFLSARRLVVVDGLLDRFEPRGPVTTCPSCRSARWLCSYAAPSRSVR